MTMKWKAADYDTLLWAIENESPFYGQSGQAYYHYREEDDPGRSFSFTLPNQTVIKLRPALVNVDILFQVYIDGELFDDLNDTNQIRDQKLRDLVETAIADFAYKAMVNRDLLKVTTRITDRQKAAKQAELLAKLP
jgi:hypothetical protein